MWPELGAFAILCVLLLGWMAWEVYRNRNHNSDLPDRMVALEERIEEVEKHREIVWAEQRLLKARKEIEARSERARKDQLRRKKEKEAAEDDRWDGFMNQVKGYYDGI